MYPLLEGHKLSLSAATLLIVGGGDEALPGIRLAREMGLYVVVSDRDPDAPGLKAADHPLLASVYDPEETAQAAWRYHNCVRRLDGVLCIATDAPVTVASVAHRLGLPGLPVEVARLATDKLAMKERFRAAGVPVPWFAPVESCAHLRRIVAHQDYPLVLKPVDSRGARGVLRVTPELNLEWAFQKARRFSPTGRVMVERYLSGPQVSTESVVLDGVAYTPGFSDRNYRRLEQFAPYFVEDGGTLPSTLAPETQRAIRKLVEKAAHALGVTNGVIKGDIVVHDGEPYVIEVAARLSGGFFCTHQIPLNCGVEIVRTAIRLALGESVVPRELQPKYQRGVAQRFCFPAPGRVVSVSGVEQVRNRPGIAFCEVRVAPGDRVPPVDCHPARVGSVIAVAETRAEAVEAAEQAVKDIIITTRPT